MKTLIQTLFILFSITSSAFAQGQWVRSISQLNYQNPDRIGAVYQQGNAFFAMLTCVPGQSNLSVELGFPSGAHLDAVDDQIYLQVNGVNYLPGFQNTTEIGFLQVYPRPGFGGQAWGGQDAFLAVLQGGGDIQVMAIGNGGTDVARRLAVIQGEAGISEVFAACRPFPVVASPTAPAPEAPAQPADVAGVDLGSQEQRIGAWRLFLPEGNLRSLAMQSVKEGDGDWDDVTLTCDDSGAYVMTLYSDGGPGGIFHQPTVPIDAIVDGVPYYIKPWNAEPYSASTLLPAMLLGALRTSGNLTLKTPSGSRFDYPLAGFSDAFAQVEKSCEGGRDGVQAWRMTPVFKALSARLHAEVQQICAASGMGYQVLPDAFQAVPGTSNEIVFSFNYTACIGDGWPQHGAGSCGAAKCEHRVYQNGMLGYREVDIYLR